MVLKKRGKENYLSRLKKLFLHPSDFFNSVEKEKKYMDILFFYIKISSVVIVLNLIFSVTSNPIKLILGIIVGVLSFGFIFTWPFISSGITHLFVILFGGKNGYFNTFKPVVYSLSILSIYGILFTIIAGIIGILIINNQSISTRILIEGITMLRDSSSIWCLIVIIVVTIGMIPLIHKIYSKIIGISKFQKISKLRASFVVLISEVIPILIILTLIGFAWVIIRTVIEKSVIT